MKKNTIASDSSTLLLLTDREGRVIGRNQAAEKSGLQANPGSFLCDHLCLSSRRVFLERMGKSGVFAVFRDGHESFCFFDSVMTECGSITVIYGEDPHRGSAAEGADLSLYDDFRHIYRRVVPNVADNEAERIFMHTFMRYGVISEAIRSEKSSRQATGLCSAVSAVCEEYRRIVSSDAEPCRIEVLPPLSDGIVLCVPPDGFAAFMASLFSFYASATGRRKYPGISLRARLDKKSVILEASAHPGSFRSPACSEICGRCDAAFTSLAASLPEQSNILLILSRIAGNIGFSPSFGNSEGAFLGQNGYGNNAENQAGLFMTFALHAFRPSGIKAGDAEFRRRLGIISDFLI